MNQPAHQTISWQPPPRPEWVQRLNEEGDCMDISGVVPLDEASLLNSAIAASGFSDFGEESWREPFRVFIKALEEEAELNLMGRLRTRSEILLHLQARLEVEEAYKQHPEIENEVVTQPVIVIGQGRSGTSFLCNLLGANSDNEALLQWEATFPCPPPEKASYKTDPRIKKAHKLIDQWNRVTPTMPSIHEFAGNFPCECGTVMAMNFMSVSWLDTFGQVPTYDGYMMQQDIEPALLYHRRVLKLLQWKNPRKHWVLKDVSHIDWLPQLLNVYPDALLVWTHRDPVKALASTINTVGTLHWGRSDFPLTKGSYDYVTDPVISAQRFNHVIEQLESGAIPREQVYNLHYQHLVNDPIGTIEAMYSYFNLELSPEGRKGMERYLLEHPREARPPHKVQTVSKSEIETARAAYSTYQEYFNIPSET